MKFELTEKQIKKYEEWKGTLPEFPTSRYTGIGGEETFSFTPTSLGVIVKVTYKIPFDDWDSGNLGIEKEFTIDLSEYDEW